MAAGAFIIPDLPKLNYFNATGILGANVANFRLALVSSGYVPNNATDELWAAASGSEIANGNGYLTGGGVLTGVALTQAAGVVKFTSNAFVWTAAGGSIPAWRHAVLYYLGTLNAKLNPIVARFLGDGTNIDVPATTVGNTLTFTPNAAGIITAT
jgi:hypothetical protein